MTLNLVIDKTAALEITGGDEELARELLEACLVESPKIIADAKSKVGEGDFVSARRCGHSLKSGFGAVGALAAAEAANQLEFCEADDAAQFETAIESVELAFQALVEAAKR